MGEGTKGGLVEETYEMSAGQGGVGWVFFLTLYSLFTLIFINVCMGEGRTASWRNLWNECRGGAGRGGVGWFGCLFNPA